MVGYILGIDGGTEGVKSGVYDLQGKLLGMGIAHYNTYHPKPGWAEQKIEEWRKCLIES